jgi:lipoprotein-anchoring transpeptidase ErfK/SrfK
VRVSLGALGAKEYSLAGRIVLAIGAASLLTASGTAVGLKASNTAAVRPASSSGAKARTVVAPKLTVSPADGTRDARPDLGVVVKAANGTLDDVVVRSKGARVPGAISKDHKSWRTLWALAPGSAYTVRATATGRKGRSSTASSAFTTLQATQSVAVSDVTPAPGETVGVGMPIIVTFDRQVLNKDRVERSLVVRSARAVQGAWHWISDQQVIFRTKRYWQPHQQITFTAHLAGVRAAKDVYGAADLTEKFSVGDANMSTVDVATHRMVVARDGKRVRDVGISAGRGGDWRFTTTNGIHAVMGKHDPVVMTSEWMGITDPKDPLYYKLTVNDAVQISSSGEYVHSAPWSVWAQGESNVSHGCVNTSPEFAAWFYGISQRGDIVTVTGTERGLEWNNGFGYWQMPWKQWVQGSALKQPVATVGTLPIPKPIGHLPLHG